MSDEISMQEYLASVYRNQTPDAANKRIAELERERDAARQSRRRIVLLARRYCALNQMNLAFFLDSEKLLRDARIKCDAANKRAEQAEADARALAERVFETEILTDSEIEIVARYIQREQMERAGYLK